MEKILVKHFVDRVKDSWSNLPSIRHSFKCIYWVSHSLILQIHIKYLLCIKQIISLPSRNFQFSIEKQRLNQILSDCGKYNEGNKQSWEVTAFRTKKGGHKLARHTQTWSWPVTPNRIWTFLSFITLTQLFPNLINLPPNSFSRVSLTLYIFVTVFSEALLFLLTLLHASTFFPMEAILLTLLLSQFP